MPLLKVAGPGGIGHVFKSAPLDVLEHHVRDQCRVGHPAGPEVGVEVTVVVDVAEVCPHRRDRPVEPDLLAHFAESLSTEVAVEVGVAGVLQLQAHVVGHDVAQGGRSSR